MVSGIYFSFKIDMSTEEITFKFMNNLSLNRMILFYLQNIRKRTAEGDEQHGSLSSIIKAVELSIRK